MYVQVYTNHGRQRSGGATIGKPYLHREKRSLPRTSWLISMKLGADLFWVKRIRNCSQEGPGSFPR
jgi:hypothetical protein